MGQGQFGGPTVVCADGRDYRVPDTKSPCVVIGVLVLVRFQVSLHAREHSTHASRLRAQPQLGTGHWTQRSAQSAHAPHRSSRGQSTIAGVCAQQKSTHRRDGRGLSDWDSLFSSLRPRPPLLPSALAVTRVVSALGSRGHAIGSLSQQCQSHGRSGESHLTVSKPDGRSW